jgi:hypothetical protein
LILDAYAPATGNNIFKCQKNYEYWQSMCARQVSWKTDMFVSYVKKKKKCLMKRFLLAPIFVLFTHDTNNIDFHETTFQAHRMSRCGRDIVCWIFLTFWNAFKTHLKNNAPGCKKTLSQPVAFLNFFHVRTETSTVCSCSLHLGKLVLFRLAHESCTFPM